MIELLVVISIMAVIGVFIVANYRSFGEDQKLKNAVLDIQSLIRQAQANATTNLKCNTQSNAVWQVEYNNATTINLKCQEPSASPITKKTLTLGANIEIQSVSEEGTGCPSAPPFASPFPTISFAPLTGKITLGSDERCTSLTITVRNNKISTDKSLTVEKGGRIYAQ